MRKQRKMKKRSPCWGWGYEQIKIQLHLLPSCMEKKMNLRKVDASGTLVAKRTALLHDQRNQRPVRPIRVKIKLSAKNNVATLVLVVQLNLYLLEYQKELCHESTANKKTGRVSILYSQFNFTYSTSNHNNSHLKMFYIVRSLQLYRKNSNKHTTLYEQAFGNSGEEKLPFKKEKPQAELSTVTGWGRGEREQRSESQSLTND